MALPAVLVVLPIGTLFLLSGFIINFFQAFFFILVRPVSKNTYRKINKVIAELLWLELIWLIDWWAGIKVEMHTDLETSQLLGKEHALVICNHRSDIDWLIGWVLTQRAGCLGSALAIMKREVKILPIIGWSMWFCGYIFLERRWTNDESTLKGFVAAVSHMRSFVPAIYDCTIAIPKNQPPPTMLRLFRGQTSVVKVQIRRHLMSELPETDDGVSQWCKDVFVTKPLSYKFSLVIRMLYWKNILIKDHSVSYNKKTLVGLRSLYWFSFPGSVSLFLALSNLLGGLPCYQHGKELQLHWLSWSLL